MTGFEHLTRAPMQKPQVAVALSEEEQFKGILHNRLDDGTKVSMGLRLSQKPCIDVLNTQYEGVYLVLKVI